MNIYKLAGSIGSALRKMIMVAIGSMAGCMMAIRFAKKGGWL